MLNSSKIPIIRGRTWAEINLDNAVNNFECIKSNTKSKICCVIKADSYGHGAIQMACLYQLLGADYLAVSNIEEALQLRKNNIHLPIMILGYTSCECAKVLAENNITQCVFSYDYGIKLSNAAHSQNVIVKVHIKVDTGMGRIGFLCRAKSPNEIEKAIEICNAPGLDVEGIFMHFAVADEGFDGEPYTREQFQNFMVTISIFKKHGVEFKIKHCSNSAAIFDYPEYHLDMVRAGVVLYGLKPSEQVKNMPNLKPVMSLHSIVAHLKIVEEGQTVSYGRTYTSRSSRMIATVPIGYADGFRRMNGQQRYSLCINGNDAPIVGRVCMDQLMVDVTNIKCNIGDEVIVFNGSHPYTVDEIAKINNTINYEIVCDISKRVPRAYVKEGKIVEWKDDILGE